MSKISAVKSTSSCSATVLTVLSILIATRASADVNAAAPDISPSEKVANEKNTNGFFPAHSKWFDGGDASTVFASELEKSESPEVGFYTEREEKKEADLADDEMVIAPPGMQPAQKKPFDPKKATVNDFIQEFGDPKEEAAINPIDNSPKPFKGMMAAMETGNEELAYQYAKQYVRHIKNVQERTKKVSDFTEIAMEKEGMAPPSTGNKNPYKYLLEKDYQAEEAEADENSEDQDADLSRLGQFDDEGNDMSRAKAEAASQDPKIQALLRKAEKSEESKQTLNPPVDPKGEVDLLLFFDPAEQNSKMVQAAQKVFEAFQNNPKVHVTGFSMQPLAPQSMKQFDDATQTSFPKKNGGKEIGMKLGVTKFPTALFIAKSSGQSFQLVGDQFGEQVLATAMKMAGKTSAHGGNQ